MKKHHKKRLIRTLKLSLIAMVIGGSIGFIQFQAEKESGGEYGRSTLTPIDGASALGGAFSLIDHNGKPVTQADYAGSHTIVFFGFTACPTICPTELAKITNVLEILGEKGEKLQPLFISVDPERDTPDVMREYVAQFHPRIIGLTGTKEQTQTIVEAYKVFAQKSAIISAKNYSVDHSATLYLMSPQGTLIALYRGEDSAQTIARDISELL